MGDFYKLKVGVVEEVRDDWDASMYKLDNGDSFTCNHIQ